MSARRLSTVIMTTLRSRGRLGAAAGRAEGSAEGEGSGEGEEGEDGSPGGAAAARCSGGGGLRRAREGATVSASRRAVTEPLDMTASCIADRGAGPESGVDLRASPKSWPAPEWRVDLEMARAWRAN